MATVTNIRVESNSETEAVIRWTDNGGASNKVYRSTDGSSYSLVATVALLDEIFEDSGLTGNTLYYYKVTNDNGSTYSAVVTVYTQKCQDRSNHGLFTVPRFAGTEQQSLELNLLAEKVEQLDSEGFDPTDFERCISCVHDGQLILNCNLGCEAFSVTAEENINSITVNGCKTCPPDVNFGIPAGMSISICGWPGDCLYDGDECHEAVIEGGATGRVFNSTTGTSHPGFSRGSSPGGDCIDTDELNILCKVLPASGEGDELVNAFPDDPDGVLSCGVVCDGTADDSGREMQMIACGGTSPYTWEFDDCGGIMEEDTLVGDTVNLTQLVFAGAACTALMAGCVIPNVMSITLIDDEEVEVTHEISIASL